MNFSFGNDIPETNILLNQILFLLVVHEIKYYIIQV